MMGLGIGGFLRAVGQRLGVIKEEPKGLNLSKYLSLEHINKVARQNTGSVNYRDSYVAPNGPSKGSIKSSGNGSSCGGTCGA